MLTCKFCNKECIKRSHKNHEFRCPLNINRVYKNGMLGKKGSNQYIKAKENGLEKPIYDFSKRGLHGCFAWTTEQRSDNAKKHNFGGYRENSGHSKKYKVLDSFGKQTTLQSSYELLCAKILDNLNIKWFRPSYLKYNDKKYFPDFYLPNFDIYLDPKNNYKALQDEKKINKVIKENNVKVYVLTLDLLTEDNIKRLCS